MNTIGRRNFLKAAASAAALSTVPSRVLGANDRIRLGVIGSGNRAREDMGHFLKNPSVEVAAVCDVWDESRSKAQEKLPAKAAEFVDHRAVLDRKDVDAVLIATPDHWHAPICIAACEAGKDVYIEKPLTLTPEEGPRIVKAARDHNRVVQVG